MELDDDPLAERRGRRVDGLLRRGHPRDHVDGRDRPPDPQPGEEDLRERAAVHDLGAPACEGGDRREIHASVAQVVVRIVLDDDRPVTRGELDERLAARE